VDHVGDAAAVAGAARLSADGTALTAVGRENAAMPEIPSFAALARRPDPRLDELALAIAAEFGAVDAAAATAALDALGGELAELAAVTTGGPDAQARACAELLGGRHGFAGDRRDYDDPANSMLDVVLRRRLGLPILLSVVYVEVARRAGIPLAGVGLPGHFVVGHFGATPPLLLDPFAGGRPLEGGFDERFVRPWDAHETALRMLNNLVGSYQRRGDLGAAIRAAAMRLELPAEASLHDALRTELRTMQARLN
jgi:regulator of sirC expression with transglutaminase-like and TPR domain